MSGQAGQELLLGWKFLLYHSQVGRGAGHVGEMQRWHLLWECWTQGKWYMPRSLQKTWLKSGVSDEKEWGLGSDEGMRQGEFPRQRVVYLSDRWGWKMRPERKWKGSNHGRYSGLPRGSKAAIESNLCFRKTVLTEIWWPGWWGQGWERGKKVYCLHCNSPGNQVERPGK